MRFSSSLKFNAVSEWWDDYIAYDSLKKTIYQLEKEQQDPLGSYHDIESNERTSLVTGEGRPTDNIFIPLLDRELKKITLFYENQEKELFEELQHLEELVRQQDEIGMSANHYLEDGFDDDDPSDDDSPRRSRDGAWGSNSASLGRRRRLSSSAARYHPSPLQGPAEIIPEEPPNHPRRYSVSSNESNELEDSLASLNRSSMSPKGTLSRLTNKIQNMRSSATGSDGAEYSIWTARTNYAYDTRLLFKRRIMTLYKSFSSLRSYVEVNYSGFRKILKKYDKVTYGELKDRYLHEIVESALPFALPTKDRLNEALNRLVELYAKCVAAGDRAAAKQQLRLFQRENIAWERDTVWRQMIGRARTGNSPMAISVSDESTPLFTIPIPLVPIPVTKQLLSLLVAVAVFAVLLVIPTVKGGEASRCLAILVFCTILWATEAIPLFVTSLLVPFLLVVFQVIRAPTGDPDVFEHLTPEGATKYVFSVMFSPTIMLLIGGFTISSALSKTNIDRILITRVLSLAGSRPNTVLLAFMAVSCFASMWISNVAAPTLCFTLIKPILRNLPRKAAMGPALILGIALAANIGGQSSPISSPQNLIALQEMDPPLDWGSWFAVALPVSAISIVLIWGLLIASYRPSRSPDGDSDVEIKSIRPTTDKFTFQQYWVSFTCLLTIALWCVAHELEHVLGDMGVIALIPLVAFFGTGVLKKVDFEQFAWTIVFLAMGGIALGKGVTSSGLLDVMDTGIRHLVQGFSLYTVVMILSPIVLVVSTFISHTIASVLLVPIASQVAANIEGQPRTLLIFITALICSTGMGMPVSGFPNQTAATQENDLGEMYLTNVDFLKNGVPASIVATLVVSTIGFLLMRLIGL